LLHTRHFNRIAHDIDTAERAYFIIIAHYFRFHRMKLGYRRSSSYISHNRLMHYSLCFSHDRYAFIFISRFTLPSLPRHFRGFTRRLRRVAARLNRRFTPTAARLITFQLYLSPLLSAAPPTTEFRTINMRAANAAARSCATDHY
jgi:hypothetical protein